MSETYNNDLLEVNALSIEYLSKATVFEAEAVESIFQVFKTLEPIKAEVAAYKKGEPRLTLKGFQQVMKSHDIPFPMAFAPLFVRRHMKTFKLTVGELFAGKFFNSSLVYYYDKLRAERLPSSEHVPFGLVCRWPWLKTGPLVVHDLDCSTEDEGFVFSGKGQHNDRHRHLRVELLSRLLSRLAKTWQSPQLATSSNVVATKPLIIKRRKKKPAFANAT